MEDRREDGEIRLICGCMFGGKTTELLRNKRRYERMGQKCALIKFARDVRYSVNGIVTHDNISVDGTYALTRLEDAPSDIAEKYDVICIDEGQFFDDIDEVAERWANEGCMVLVAALDGTFQRKPFECIARLIPKCERIKKLSAICGICHMRKANFSKRMGDSQKIVDIGGADKYVATCRSCFVRS